MVFDLHALAFDLLSYGTDDASRPPARADAEQQKMIDRARR
jgi:hypothetical protein